MQHPSNSRDRVMHDQGDAGTEAESGQYLFRLVRDAAVRDPNYDLFHVAPRPSAFRYTAGRTYSNE